MLVCTQFPTRVIFEGSSIIQDRSAISRLFREIVAFFRLLGIPAHKELLFGSIIVPTLYISLGSKMLWKKRTRHACKCILSLQTEENINIVHKPFVSLLSMV